MPQTLETPRLRLRELGFDDLEALNAIQSDADHMRFYPHPFSIEESRSWIEKNLVRYERLGYGLWAVEDKQTGEFLGNVGPTLQQVDGVGEVELGWSITPTRARQGLASEAAAACRDDCFGRLDLSYVIALIRPENTRSRGVAERIGMTVWKETTHASMPHLVYRIDRRRPVDPLDIQTWA
jgi:ribosomal-protein-alanine N-acetyltransferase